MQIDENSMHSTLRNSSLIISSVHSFNYHDAFYNNNNNNHTTYTCILNIYLSIYSSICFTHSYVDNHESLNVLLPIGALRLVRCLQHISHDHFLLLSADKAHAHEEDLCVTKGNPHLAIHGSFSFMTNFHALDLYFGNQQGVCFHTPYYSGLQVAAYVMGEMPISEFKFAWEVGIIDYAYFAILIMII